ncbi:hypothetical protein [Arthrobacter sp. MDT1-65]
MNPLEVWASPEWKAEADQWIDAALEAFGVRRLGPSHQPRLRLWSTQLTVPTDHGTLWFKENNPGQLAEASIMSLLGELAPDHVAAPLAIEPSRGWMLTADHGATLDSLDPDDPAAWSRIAGDFADLQQLVAPHGERLTRAGLVLMNPEVAANFVENQLLLHTGLPAGHPLYLSAEEADAVVRGLPALHSAVDTLRGIPVPLSLDHNDLQARNCFLPGADTDPVRFFDFADAYWAHPFSALLVPVTEMCGRWGTTADDPRIQAVIGTYLERWTAYAPLADLRAAVEPALRLARVHRYGAWLRLLVYADDASMRSYAPAALHHLRTLAGPVLRA